MGTTFVLMGVEIYIPIHTSFIGKTAIAEPYVYAPAR